MVAGAQEGPDGATPTTLVASHTWNTVTIVRAGNDWTPLLNSGFEGATKGGPLQIQMNVHMRDADAVPVPEQMSACAPFIDGQWAGDYGGLPTPPAGGPFWPEGLLQTTRLAVVQPFGWRQWAPTRVYPGVPKGNHWFDVRCATNAGALGVNAGPPFPFIPSYISVLELHHLGR